VRGLRGLAAAAYLIGTLIKCPSILRPASVNRAARLAIYHLGERRGAELGTDNAFDRPGIASVSRSRLAPANTQSIMGPDDLASLSQ
jgi:hypothetical protein